MNMSSNAIDAREAADVQAGISAAYCRPQAVYRARPASESPLPHTGPSPSAQRRLKNCDGALLRPGPPEPEWHQGPSAGGPAAVTDLATHCR